MTPALLALFVLWTVPTLSCNGLPAGQLRAEVLLFENRCEFDAFGRAIEVADGAGVLHPKCTTTLSRQVPGPPLEVPEPRINELYGWPGMLEGVPPVVVEWDLAGNSMRSDGGCP